MAALWPVRRPAPSASAIVAKKSALQGAASTACGAARVPAAPHGPGERTGQSFARARALTRCQRAAPRNRLAHRRAAGHTCRGQWMPRRQRTRMELAHFDRVQFKYFSKRQIFFVLCYENL